jgi:hypothetical protein
MAEAYRVYDPGDGIVAWRHSPRRGIDLDAFRNAGYGAVGGMIVGGALGMVAGAVQVHKENVALRKAFKAHHPELYKEANSIKYYRGKNLKTNGMISGKDGNSWGVTFGDNVRIAPAAKYNSEVFHLTMGHEGLHAKGYNNEWGPVGSGLDDVEHLNIYQWELNTAKHFNFSQDVIDDIHLRMQKHHNKINSEMPWDQFEPITNWNFGVYP